MKPAFPTVVCEIPICCRVEAHPRAIPHKTPPLTRIGPLIARPSGVRCFPSAPGAVIRF